MTTDKQKWFSYGAIRFTPEQVEWILQNLTTLEAGRWPKEPIARDLENPESAYSTGSPPLDDSVSAPSVDSESLPEELTGTGDYFTKTYKVYSTGDKASFIKPVLIAAEITARMDSCGDDGVLCERYYRGESQKSLANEARLYLNEFEECIDRVKGYIRRWRRKRISFRRWCRLRRRR